MVCLGSNINSNSENAVYTTVNQTYFYNDLKIYSTNSKIKTSRYFTLKNNKLQKIIHGGIQYYFPNPMNLIVKTENKQGRWADINVSGSKHIQKSEIFSIVIDHGIKPSNSVYSYIVEPCKDGNYTRANDLLIIANDATKQAVYDIKNDILQIVFFKPSTCVINESIIKTDKPGIMIIKNITKSKAEIYFSDPTQKIENISISYNDFNYNAKLPTGNFRGVTSKIN